MKERKLFIVSNRLPISMVRENNVPVIKPSTGGLVSAMNSFLQNNKEVNEKDFKEVVWVGCPGCTHEEWKGFQKQIQQEKFSYLPVFIDDETYRGYYDSFSNSTIWPLFHYFPSYTEYNNESFSHYINANRAFEKVISEHAKDDDVIWIHDYHLMLLPKMLREIKPKAGIGFFLHIPFPSYEIFRLLPNKWGRELLNGMLGADTVGFHTNDYVMHFLKSVQRILGCEDDLRLINYENRMVKADIFPISVDFAKFNEAFDNPEIEISRKELQNKFPNNKIIFSVDRLDYTKGIEYRLRGYKKLLDDFSQYRGKVVFILILVPSRDSIDQYSERKKMINEIVGHINSIYGTLEWQPVIYRYAHLDFKELLTFYTGCDLALITPIRDGMNLVAKEFVASRKDKRGVLILSEMTGAANELGEALIVNPTDKEDVTVKIRQALDMPEAEQEFRMANMQQRIRSYDVNHWANDFLTQLTDTRRKQEQFAVRFLNTWQKLKMAANYVISKKRLLLLDYDGTLVNFTGNPEMAAPTNEVLRMLNRISSSSKNDVFIISGRTGTTLEQWFGKLPVHLVAEHGAKIRMDGSKWQTNIHSTVDWKSKAVDIMRSYEQRCANSFYEDKEFSVAWHYRNSETDLGELRAKELHSELNDVFKNTNVQVVNGNKVIELRSLEADKGTAVSKIASHNNYDFILAAGDDRTDEDMFRALKDKNAWTVKIGAGISSARYNIETPKSFLSLLGLLI